MSFGRSFPAWVALLLLLAACAGRASDGDQPAARRLTVFAAASLTEVFQELGREFEAAHPGVEVSFNFAGSQQLLAQLAHGARGDVFAPASPKELAAAIESSLVLSGTQRIFAYNRLVVICPEANAAGLRELADLARPGVKIDIADQSVPVGRYTLALLDSLRADGQYGPQFVERVLANVVSHEENVRAVVSKVQLGEVDAGIVYSSDATSSPADDLAVLAIPDRHNPVASYPIAPLAQASEPALARQFVELVLAERGQQVLRTYGFTVAGTHRP